MAPVAGTATIIAKLARYWLSVATNQWFSIGTWILKYYVEEGILTRSQHNCRTAFKLTWACLFATLLRQEVVSESKEVYSLQIFENVK